jgi:hypothetical protein
MKHLELVEKYLETNRARGLGNGYTLNSFINLCCSKNKAKVIQAHETLRLGLQYSPNVFVYYSYHGGIAYYPIDMIKEKKIIAALAKMQGIKQRTLIIVKRRKKSEKRN